MLNSSQIVHARSIGWIIGLASISGPEFIVYMDLSSAFDNGDLWAQLKIGLEELPLGGLG